MNLSDDTWTHWRYTGLFVCVLLDQFGIPIPAIAAPFAAGALIAAGTMSLWVCLLTGVAGCLIADLVW